MNNNIICRIFGHKWIGAHEHDGNYNVAICVEGCVCTRCGFVPEGNIPKLPIVKDGKIT